MTTFSANKADGSAAVTASRSESNPTSSIFFADSSEAVAGVLVGRIAFVEGPATAFAFDPGLNSAALAPPFPFAGSATFQRIDDFSSRWEGPLTVSFPGDPDVPLTGRDFAWSLTSRREASGSSGVFSGSFFLHSLSPKQTSRFLK